MDSAGERVDTICDGSINIPHDMAITLRFRSNIASQPISTGT